MSRTYFDPLRRIRSALIALGMLMIVGVVGYIVIENYPVVDAFYMTVITLATVGFTEVKPLDVGGKLFTSFLIIVGLGIVAYTASLLTEVVIEGKIFRKRRLEKKVLKMQNHIIVCGYGRIGRRVVQKLAGSNIPFIVIEKEEATINELNEKHFLCIEGNAIEDEVLLKANIKNARSLVTSLNSDADNVYVTLTARSMNPSLYIVARAGDKASEEKLRRAGASKVVSPYEIGGSHMANAVLRPNVVDFMEVVSESESDKTKDLEIDEIVIPPNSSYIGKMLRDTPIRSDLNIIVLAIKNIHERVMYNPPSDHVFSEGDTIICIGFIEKLDALAKIVQA